jgi:hypothetical protein
MTGYIFQLIAKARVIAANVSQTTFSSSCSALFEFLKQSKSITTNTTMIDSGDPLVVMFRTNGFKVHNKCVGQNGAPEASSNGVTSNEMETRVSLPSNGWIMDEDRRRGSKGVYRKVARSYGLHTELYPNHQK